MTKKNVYKRIISALLVVLIVTTIFVVPVNAEPYKVGDLNYMRGFYDNVSDFLYVNPGAIEDMYSAYDKEYNRQALNDILKELNLESCSEKEKVQKIARWIFCNAQYGSKIADSVVTARPLYAFENNLMYAVTPWWTMDQTFVGIVSDGRAVCAGISETFFYIAAASGLEVLTAQGTISGKPHGWNIVKVDGKWYNVDLSCAANNNITTSLSNNGVYRPVGGFKHYIPSTGKVEYTFDFGDWYPANADGLFIDYDESKPDLVAPEITAEPACGASVKISFSKVEGAICYQIYRNYYVEGRDYNSRTGPYKMTWVGQSIATLSPKKAERNGYVFYDNTYMYDTYKEWTPTNHLSDDTSHELWEGKKYVYTVVAYGERRSFDWAYPSNSVTITTNPDKGDLKFFQWDGKLEPHTFGDPVVTVPATCGHTGIKTITCKDCGYTYYADTVRDNSNHDYTTSVVKTASCESTGQKKTECTRCGDVSYITIPATGHSWNSGEVTTAATCTTNGIKTYTCSVCKKTKTEVIKATGHNLVNPRIPVTNDCEHDGYKLSTCTICHQDIKEVLKATGHNWTPYQTTRAATCTMQGLEERTCLNCESVERRDIPLKAHSYSYIRTLLAPTCTFIGRMEYKCDSCGDTIVKETPATGHKYNENTVNATAYKMGYTSYVCKNCDHSYVSDFKAPTGKVQNFKCKTRTHAAETITWTKISSASGYQLQISNAKGNAWENNFDIKNCNTTSHTFKGLSAMSGYKFRIRFYIKGEDGKNYFGPWSTLVSPTLPKSTSISKLTAAKKSFTVKWKKQASVTGYQVQYSTNSKFSSYKTVTIKGAGNLSKAIKGLSSAKRYYVRVRTYKTISSKNYYSTWSAVKNIKTK